MICQTSTSKAAPISGAMIFSAVAETCARARAVELAASGRRGRRAGGFRRDSGSEGSALSGFSMAFMAFLFQALILNEAA
jgi:hypothetical protein